MQDHNSETRQSGNSENGNPQTRQSGGGAATQYTPPNQPNAPSEAVEEAEGTMQQARDKAMDTADQAKDKAAEGIDSAADTIREKLGPTGGVAGTAGEKIADGMEKTAGYLREHDTQEIMKEADAYVREHPTQALIGAVAVGFVIGRILR